MPYTKIRGTGGYLPQKILTNFDLEKMMDTSHDWIVERTGIHQRHIAGEHDTASSMAEAAGRIALASANLTPADIGMIIVATTTPEKIFPSTACLLQQRLEISGCPAFDLNSVACNGFIYAMSIADQFIRQGTANNILVIGSEVMSRILDWNDRSTAILFGDGAGAVVLGASDTPGILSTHLRADGNYHDVLYLPHPSVDGSPFMQMKGSALFKLAVARLGQLFDETLDANGLVASDIDWLIPHQANIRMIEAMAKKLHLPMERVAITLDKQGNTSAASIPLALDDAIRRGVITRGDTLLLEGIGGGLTWGSVLVRY